MFSINCFYVNTIVLSLVYMAFVDQDDSASGGNPQTMGLVRIRQGCGFLVGFGCFFVVVFFLILLYLFQV